MTTHEGSIPGEQSHRLEDAGRRMGRKADEFGARVETTVREGLESAGARLHQGISVTGDRVRHTVQDGRARVQSEVQEHPVRTLLYAVGVGALIGMLLASRSRRR